MSEAISTTRNKLCVYGSTTTCGTRSIFLAVILNKSEDSRTVNTNTQTNDEIVQVTDFIDSDSENCDG